MQSLCRPTVNGDDTDYEGINYDDKYYDDKCMITNGVFSFIQSLYYYCILNRLLNLRFSPNVSAVTDNTV